MYKEMSYEEFVERNRLNAQTNPRKKISYDLQVFEDDNRFTLAIPPLGELIQDDFNGMYKREALYISLENDGEIFKWLCEVHTSILVEDSVN
jgi:hypothetical protein